MRISGTNPGFPVRGTAADAQALPASASQEIPTALERLADQMKTDLATEAEARKARAKQKLAAAKEQIEFMKRWRFDPEVLARHAARIAATVGAAAREFTGSLTDGPGAAPDAGAMTASIDAASATGAADDDSTADTQQDGASLVQRAYREMQEDADSFAGISDDDRETLDEIKDLARQLKKLLEEALRRLHQDNQADQAASGEARTAYTDMSALLATADTLTATPVGISITL